MSGSLPAGRTTGARESLAGMWPWFLRRRSRDGANILFAAALEFGKTWRHDLNQLAAQRLPDLDPAERAALAEKVEQTRDGTEQWVAARWKQVHGRWSRADTEAARAFVRTAYPWMDERNVSHAVGQGTYYAWHG